MTTPAPADHAIARIAEGGERGRSRRRPAARPGERPVRRPGLRCARPASLDRPNLVLVERDGRATVFTSQETVDTVSLMAPGLEVLGYDERGAAFPEGIIDAVSQALVGRWPDGARLGVEGDRLTIAARDRLVERGPSLELVPFHETVRSAADGQVRHRHGHDGRGRRPHRARAAPDHRRDRAGHDRAPDRRPAGRPHAGGRVHQRRPAGRRRPQRAAGSARPPSARSRSASGCAST